LEGAKRIRGRDIRAIAFCTLSIPAVFALAFVLLADWRPAAAVAAGYAVWLLTRARMIRVMRRLRGETIVERGGYYQE
jgi:hypothetical protein